MADEKEERYKETDKLNKVNAVREEYKRYKKRDPPPDFSDVIDFENPDSYRGRVNIFNLNFENIDCSESGLINPSDWQIFEVASCPGFLFIVNPFKNSVQHYFIQRSLKAFPCKPNVTNLDAHMTINEGQSIWDTYEKSDTPNLIEKLRWTHLGYQFDYNNVQYKPDMYYGFPQDLAKLTCHIASVLGYPNYQPESGVINYYPLGSSMGGHVDKYENDLSQPLISFSFGQSAVYLIGGKTIDVRPEAIFVKSGDIIVMTGESRLAYHAVPCIVKTETNHGIPECLNWDKCDDYDNIFKPKDVCNRSFDNDCPVCKNYNCEYELEQRQDLAKTEDDWKPFISYLAKTRININVRQVHKPEENVQLYLTS